MNTEDYKFSASSIREYLQCGLKFKFHRVTHETPGQAASHHRWFGTLVHNAIYAGLAKHKSSKELVLREKPDAKIAIKLLETAWSSSDFDEEDSVTQIVLKDLGDRPTGNFYPGRVKSLGKGLDLSQEELEAGWLDEARHMVLNGLKSVKTIHTILELERALEWTMQDRSFRGFADIIAKDKNGRIEFYDFKTQWDKPSPKKMEEDFQFFSYSYALKQILELDYFPTGYLAHLHSGKLVPYTVDESMIEANLAIVQRVVEGIENDLYPADYGGRLCPYCDFKHICYPDGNVWQRK